MTKWSHDVRVDAARRLADIGHPDGHEFDLELCLRRPAAIEVLHRQAIDTTREWTLVPYFDVLRDVALGKADALADVVQDGNTVLSDPVTLADFDRLLARHDDRTAA